MKKIVNLFNRIKAFSKDFYEDFKEFGFRVAFVKYFCAVFFFHNSSLYINTLQNYINKYFSKINKSYMYIYRYSKIENDNFIFSENDKIPIWFCWLQGEGKMPELNKICYNRLREVIPKDRFEIKFISFDNIKNYVDFPDFILRKVQTGNMAMAHLADYLRYCLLRKYGGFWVDSTIFFTDFDFNKLFDIPFFTGKCSKIIKTEPGGGQSSNSLWYVNSDMAKMFFNIFYELCLVYWLEHNRILDYVIADYILNFELEHLPWAKEMFDSVEPNMDNFYGFDKNMNETYSDNLYSDLFHINQFQKLSNKHKYKKIDSNGNKTLYGYLCERYLSL